MKLLIYFLLIVVRCQSRLVFPKGTDVGYIVPDPVQELDDIQAPLIILKEDQLSLNRQTREDSLHQSEGSLYNDLWYPHQIVHKVDSKAGKVNIDGKGIDASLKDSKHGIKMGQSNVHCDDAIHNLQVDWDFSPANYTCYTPRLSLPAPSTSGALKDSLLYCDIPPAAYSPQHHCMDSHIEYSDRIPSYGDHRPLWPQFGEYKFVPPQRWLHNIEHGAVVMLYHPCTLPSLVSDLSNIVRQCLYKHIITPYTPLTRDRPLALVAWGCVLEMSSVNATEVKQFIRQRALKGPEGILRKQGMFTEGLVNQSPMPEGHTDKDILLCSN